MPSSVQTSRTPAQSTNVEIATRMSSARKPTSAQMPAAVSAYLISMRIGNVLDTRGVRDMPARRHNGATRRNQPGGHRRKAVLCDSAAACGAPVVAASCSLPDLLESVCLRIHIVERVHVSGLVAVHEIHRAADHVADDARQSGGERLV